MVRTVRLYIPQRQFLLHEVKQLREQFGMSQAIFAQFIGVLVKTLQDWQQGAKRPSPLAYRLLPEMAAKPDY